MKIIIDLLNKINKINRSYLIIHNDLETNDWTSLFYILNNQENIYFGLGNGRSFYNQCLPNNCLLIIIYSLAFKKTIEYIKSLYSKL